MLNRGSDGAGSRGLKTWRSSPRVGGCGGRCSAGQVTGRCREMGDNRRAVLKHRCGNGKGGHHTVVALLPSPCWMEVSRICVGEAMGQTLAGGGRGILAHG